MTEWGGWGGADQYLAMGYEHLSAPNRYRKLFKGLNAEIEASPALGLLVAEGSPGFDAAVAAATIMAANDWPEKAARFVGIEPHINLCDIVLLWTIQP